MPYPKLESTLRRKRAHSQPRGPTSAQEFADNLLNLEIRSKMLDRTISVDKVTAEDHSLVLILTSIQISQFVIENGLQNTLFHMDGTFKSCPEFFQQLFTIHVNYKNTVSFIIYSVFGISSI